MYEHEMGLTKSVSGSMEISKPHGSIKHPTPSHVGNDDVIVALGCMQSLLGNI